MNTVRINGQDYTSSLSDAEIAFIGNLSLPTTAQTLSGAIAEHENDISELNSNLTSIDVTSRITFNQTMHDWTKVSANKYQVSGAFRFTTPTTVSNDYVLGTLPADLKPKHNIFVPLLTTWTGAVAGILLINTAGSITLASNVWTANKGVVVTFSYVL